MEATCLSPQLPLPWIAPTRPGMQVWFLGQCLSTESLKAYRILGRWPGTIQLGNNKHPPSNWLGRGHWIGKLVWCINAVSSGLWCGVEPPCDQTPRTHPTTVDGVNTICCPQLVPALLDLHSRTVTLYSNTG